LVADVIRAYATVALSRLSGGVPLTRVVLVDVLACRCIVLDRFGDFDRGDELLAFLSAHEQTKRGAKRRADGDDARAAKRHEA
jgi:hypothetical protein